MSGRWVRRCIAKEAAVSGRETKRGDGSNVMPEVLTRKHVMWEDYT